MMVRGMALAFLVCLLVPAAALAQTDEIQVYDGGLADSVSSI